LDCFKLVTGHSVTKKTEFWFECYGNLVVALSLHKQLKYNSGGAVTFLCAISYIWLQVHFTFLKD
jgi:hypothetical protein